MKRGGRMGFLAVVALAAPLLAPPGAAPAGAAWAASFDCAKARTPDEQLICGNPELSRADEHLAESYKALIGGVQAHGLDTAVRDRLRAEQRAWLTRRNAVCGVTATTRLTTANRAELASCLRGEVEERIGKIDRLRDGLPVSALVEPQRIAETNKAKRYKIDVSYPALPAAVTGANAFNALAEKRVRPAIEAFRENVPAGEDLPDGDAMSALDIGYDIAFASPRLLSVQFSFYEYMAGAAHGNPASGSLHVDLARGRALAAGDVFAAGRGWERALADHALADLRRQAKADGFELFDGAADTLPDIVGNLDNWRLESDQALIVFDPYAVAAYAAGRREVAVPYALLKPYLKPDGPLPPRR